MQLTVFFDVLCPYAWRAFRMRGVRHGGSIW